MIERRRIVIGGTVQGVGFRPFLYRTAAQLGLKGAVRNQQGTVHADLEGEGAALDAFLARLRLDAPPLAEVRDVVWAAAPLRQPADLRIDASEDDGGGSVRVSPDVATCADCRHELADPGDRRFGYPFLNCVNCGPRFTLIHDVPYDRERTSMGGFSLCRACRAEYNDPNDRRFHAQPTACGVCGPALLLSDAAGEPLEAVSPLVAAASRLLAGELGAVKGLGGYHLACDATQGAAVALLRLRKGRPEKAFAVMVADLAEAETLCELEESERQLLQSIARPIVLARRWANTAVAEAVAPASPWLGVMLAYAPIHHELLKAVGRPLVMTSGNLTDEPMATDNAEAHLRMRGIADFFLEHDRPIVSACDDSVMRCSAGGPLPLRRARGYVPQPLSLACPKPTLALGGHTKSTFCLSAGNDALLSQHLGDLDDYASYTHYVRTIEHFERLFRVRPEVLVHDLHPDYASTRYAEERAQRDGLARLGVQHHHAHVASCLAEHEHLGTVIGVAFDGTGYGTDGAVWGGEIFSANTLQATRLAHLRYVGMPGGAQAIREPWRMAVAYLLDAELELHGMPSGAAQLTRLLKATPPVMTSSVGRLFDAVAAMCQLRQTISYDGQAAMELEGVALSSTDTRAYTFDIHASASKASLLELDPRPVIRAIAEDLRAGTSRGDVARRFHRGLARMVVSACVMIRETTGLATVALSGGVFCNTLLTAEVVDLLRARDFAVLQHRRVPPNDGGLSLGQLAVAAARLTAGGSELARDP